jgi:hypothetical protein
MGEYAARCGKGVILAEFDPPDALTIAVKNKAAGKCKLAVSFIDAFDANVRVNGKLVNHVAPGDNLTLTATATKARIACGTEKDYFELDEGTPADATDCQFSYKIEYAGCCETDIVFNDRGDAPGPANNHPFTDFSTAGAIKFTQVIGSPIDELGDIQGEYLDPATGLPLAYGFFKKIEVNVSCSAGCVILGVDRKWSDIGEVGASPAGKADQPDPVKATSIDKKSPQLWIITDAPGLTRDATEDRTNLVFEKDYTITAKYQCIATRKKFTRSLDYRVIVCTDERGAIIRHPHLR